MKVGEYFRTPYGDIGKITGIPKHGKYQDDGFYLDDEFIICGRKTMKELKSTPNIIDLIKVGDYINGLKVNNIEKKENGNICIDFDNKTSYLYVKNWNYESRIEEYKIKSILTKEQFESMSYKVGE